MTDQELVKGCLREICAKNGFLQADAMVQRDIEFISQEIENATGILLSVSTIRRLLNGEFSRIPQIATLNAIAAYLGFKSWQDYKNTRNNHRQVFPANDQQEQRSAGSKKRIFHSKWFWPGLAGLSLFIFFVYLRIPASKKIMHAEQASFGARKTTANAIPNTVVFSYDIDQVNADSFFIQQSWDKRRRVRIEKGAHTLTDIYYEPGYHVAKLIANDSVIRTVDISIPTDKWFIAVKGPDPHKPPQYIADSVAFKNGFFGIDETDLQNNRVVVNEPKTFLFTYFPSLLHVSSDDFTFKARVRIRATFNNQCPYLMHEVFCQRNFMYFKSTYPGCAAETDAQFGNTILKGKTSDLSPLCHDLSQWTNIEMTVKNKQVTIVIDDKPVYHTAYDRSSGLITGLGFISNGLCEIDHVQLKGLDGKLVYENGF